MALLLTLFTFEQIGYNLNRSSSLFIDIYLAFHQKAYDSAVSGMSGRGDTDVSNARLITVVDDRKGIRSSMV